MVHNKPKGVSNLSNLPVKSKVKHNFSSEYSEELKNPLKLKPINEKTQNQKIERLSFDGRRGNINPSNAHHIHLLDTEMSNTDIESISTFRYLKTHENSLLALPDHRTHNKDLAGYPSPITTPPQTSLNQQDSENKIYDQNPKNINLDQLNCDNDSDQELKLGKDHLSHLNHLRLVNDSSSRKPSKDPSSERFLLQSRTHGPMVSPVGGNNVPKPVIEEGGALELPEDWTDFDENKELIQILKEGAELDESIQRLEGSIESPEVIQEEAQLLSFT